MFGLAAPLLALSWVAWASADPMPGQTRALTPLVAALLGAVQGATEFLPVSSSGHLALAQAWLGVDPNTAGHRFNITVHAGTLLAVVWVYRRDVQALLAAAVRPFRPSPERHLLLMIALASTPLVIVLLPGVEELVIAMETHVRLIGVALLATAVVLAAAFRNQRGVTAQPSEAPPTPRQALTIGFAQLMAVLPGISRSGSTIAAGLAVGLDRAAAARFSFLISLVAVGAASAKEALELALTPPADAAIDPVPFAVGFLSSLVVGLASLRGLLYLVGRGRMEVFVAYLAIMGTIAIVVG